MTVPLYNLTDTWNDGGTVFTGLKLNVSNTASAAGSKVFDFQVGSNSVFRFGTNNELALIPTTAYQTRFHFYQTFTDSNNYERLQLWTDTAFDNTMVIETDAAGTGTQRTLRICGPNIYFETPHFIPGVSPLWGFESNGDFISLNLTLDSASKDTRLTRGAAGVFKFASANSFSANGTVATVLGSVGPTGANTTVQNWLTIQDSGGNTRYIPCF